MNVRKENITSRNETADKIEDIEFLKMVVRKVEVESARTKINEMQITDLFPYVIEDWEKKEITTEETALSENCGLRAVLAVVSIGLMNIEDMNGSIDTEVEPFLREVRNQFGVDVAHGIGQFLFMSVLSGVSTKTGKVY